MNRLVMEDELLQLTEGAASTPNLTARLLLHNSITDLIQEMIICSNPETYFKPHRHPSPYSESYHVISGEIDIYFHDEDFNITHKINLNSSSTSFFRHQDEGYHLVVTKKPNTVFHEVLSGPFVTGRSVIIHPSAPSSLAEAFLRIA